MAKKSDDQDKILLRMNMAAIGSVWLIIPEAASFLGLAGLWRYGTTKSGLMGEDIWLWWR